MRRVMINRLVTGRKTVVFRGESRDGFQNGREVSFSVKFASKAGSNAPLCSCGESSALKLHSRSRWGWVTESIEVHDNSIFDFQWFDNDRKIATASADQTARILDVERKTVVTVLNGHFGSLRSTRVLPSQNAMVVTAGRDGNIHIWDLRSRERSAGHKKGIGPVGSVFFAHSVKKKGRNKRPFFADHSKQNFGDCQRYVMQKKFDLHRHSVTSADFVENRRDNVFSTGFADNCVKIWDLRQLSKKSPLLRSTRPFGASLISSSTPRNNEFLGVLDSSGDCHIIDLLQLLRPPGRFDAPHRSDPIVSRFRGAAGGSNYIKAAFSPEGEFVATGSGDGRICVYEVAAGRVKNIYGESNEVSGVDWCLYDFPTLAFCSDSDDVALWRVSEEINTFI